MAQMIIANRLNDGAVVFLGPGEDWSAAIEAATLIEGRADAERLLQVAKRHEQESRVVDPTLIEVREEDGRRRPVEIREAIRAFGPTVRTDLTG